MCFAARSIRDGNYKEREGERWREETREKGRERTRGLDAEGPESASRRINREPTEILPVLDPLIVGPVGADQEVRCYLRNSQIVLHIYVDGFCGCSRHLVHDQSGFR